MEDEIKVGEYCRNNRGYIFKGIKIMGNENESQVGIFDEEGRYNNLKLFPIKKHNPNIIYLIEARRLCKWL